MDVFSLEHNNLMGQDYEWNWESLDWDMGILVIVANALKGLVWTDYDYV